MEDNLHTPLSPLQAVWYCHFARRVSSVRHRRCSILIRNSTILPVLSLIAEGLNMGASANSTIWQADMLIVPVENVNLRLAAYFLIVPILLFQGIIPLIP